MLENLYNDLEQYQERMHRKSKSKFREYVKVKAEEVNLNYQINPISKLSKNIIVGNLKSAEYVIGAHYDTPPRMPSLLMKNVKIFNLIITFLVLAMIIMTYLFSIFPLITLSIYLLFLFYTFGLIGNANKYNFNDNTSGVLILLNLMKTLNNKKVAYVFFDNEEKGLFGSIQLFQMMKKYNYNLKDKKFIILDCIGVGNFFGLLSYGSKEVSLKLKDTFNNLNIENYEMEYKKTSVFEMSDHFAFKNCNHVGIICYQKKGSKFVLKNIHTHKDKYLNLNNIEVLSNVIEKYINQGESHE